jgi:hypothetical protein
MRTQAIRPRRVHDFVSSIFDYDLHAKRVDSLADATVGALQGARLAVGALGRAGGREGTRREARDQAGRPVLLEHGRGRVEARRRWVPFVIGERPEIVVALDWTDFDQDNQSTIALYVVTKHGAVPALRVHQPRSPVLRPRIQQGRASCAGSERTTSTSCAGRLVSVQKLLGHSDPKITERRYGHLLPDFMKSEVDRLRFGSRRVRPPSPRPSPPAPRGEREDFRSGRHGGERGLQERPPRGRARTSGESAARTSGAAATGAGRARTSGEAAAAQKEESWTAARRRSHPLAARLVSTGDARKTKAGTPPVSREVPASLLAGCRGLEPLASGVTGRRYNRLN